MRNVLIMKSLKKQKGMRIYLNSILVFCLFTVPNAYSQNRDIATLDGRVLDSFTLTAEIKLIMKRAEIPGLSIAIINDNELAYHEALGLSNAETREPVDSRSIFEGASLSKPVFAYFALKMVEDGTLELDKPLYEYLPHPGIAPESREEYKSVTARMVLSHQTGFPNHAKGQAINLAFKPGTDFLYSGEAYQYLAAVIGVQKGVGTGDALNALLKKEVAEPLLMEHTSFVWDDYLAAHKVYGHDEDGKPTQNRPGPGGWNGKTFNAFSSLHSEASEYAKFIIAMLNREGLSDATFEDMLKEHTHFKDDNPLKQEIGQTGWGLGFAQKRTPEWTMHLHTGNNHDFQSYAMFIPEKRYGLVVFTNSGKMVPFLENLSKILGPQF